MTTTSALTRQLGANMAATDLVPTIDVSAGLNVASELTEFGRGLLAATFLQRNVVTPFTTYNAGDIVTMNDGRVVLMKTTVTTGAGPTVFISAANFIVLGWQHIIYAASYGLTADALQSSAGANTTALQNALNAANPTGVNGAGGIVMLPRGNFYTNAFIQIPNGVQLWGNGTQGTYWSLADQSNCSIVGPHVSTGSGNPNAFYWGLRDVMLDCRQSAQGRVTSTLTMNGTTTVTDSVNNFVAGEYLSGSGILPGTFVVSGGGTTTAVLNQAAQQTVANCTVYGGITQQIYGVHCNINPLNSGQSGDFAFDPTGKLQNVHVRNARDAGFANFGRSANTYVVCKTSGALGIGFIGSFDTRYLSCESDFSGWHGFDFRGSSEQIANCKSYNSGNSKTTAAAACNQAYGYLFNGFSSYGAIAIAGCDAQQNTGHAYYLKDCQGIALAGCTAAYVGYLSANTNNVGFYLDNARQCTINGTVSGTTGNHALGLVNASTQNNISLTHFGAVGAVVGTDLLAGYALLVNTVTINGTSVNAPGLVSTATLDSAYPKQYSISTSNGSNHKIGVQGTQGVAVLNRLELVPKFPERGALQTITALTFRTGSTGVATAVTRQGVFSSDKNGGNVFTVEQELASTVDTSVANVVHTTTLTSAITVDPAKLYWVGSVPQVALGTYQTAYDSLVAGSTANPAGGYCFTQNSVTGAFANITFSTTTAPIDLAGGIAVGVTITG